MNGRRARARRFHNNGTPSRSDTPASDVVVRQTPFLALEGDVVTSSSPGLYVSVSPALASAALEGPPRTAPMDVTCLLRAPVARHVAARRAMYVDRVAQRGLADGRALCASTRPVVLPPPSSDDDEDLLYTMTDMFTPRPCLGEGGWRAAQSDRAAARLAPSPSAVRWRSPCSPWHHPA